MAKFTIPYKDIIKRAEELSGISVKGLEEAGSFIALATEQKLAEKSKELKTVGDSVIAKNAMGGFISKKVAAKEVEDPKTKEIKKIPESYSLSWVPTKTIIQTVNADVSVEKLDTVAIPDGKKKAA